MVTAAKVGELWCQRDSHARTLDTTVVSCEPSAGGAGTFDVVLADSVIFPTGGGQPNDIGTIGGVAVLDARRAGMQCVHVVAAPLEVGASVTVEVDWERRRDHMQQHSGQHILSAIAQNEFGLNTISWSLGKQLCCIEIPAAEPKQDVLDKLEARVNEVIRGHHDVTIDTRDHDESDRPEKLPGDIQEGIVRFISMGNIDRNPCCGTHVKNVAEVQCIKLLHTERVRGGNTRIFFVAGDRVFKLMQASLLRERQLTALMSTGPENFVDRVEGFKRNIKDLMKTTKKQTKELKDLAAAAAAAGVAVAGASGGDAGQGGGKGKGGSANGGKPGSGSSSIDSSKAGRGSRAPAAAAGPDSPASAAGSPAAAEAESQPASVRE
ncbi:hypothetical protein HK105_200843 [Polyrhizophydium stewartii]|uniref:Threonyl/alanyl tRNA synthetase SAD domain-containing protein n=1 Tax=Polyrhizophydium stewartii TaxID=2732419 RepID=A0ABR4NK66_9FUNG